MKNIKFDFTNKSVIVTGGAQGIGLQITTDFLAAGANVSVWDYSEEALETLKKELSSYGNQLHTAKVDVSNWDSCQKAVTSLPWPVDVLINNAGITRDKSFTKMNPEDFNSVISTNLTGLFNVTKNCLEKFSPNNTHKRIINIASVVALYGNFGQTNYAAAKAGVIGMTKTWAKELARKGFTSNVVAPGFTLTAMVKKMPQEVLDKIASTIPLQRLGETNDISSACLYLASEEAGYINGATISVDGGVVI